eukprot:1016655-Alexandrium_andersonii.AAC.1
MSVLALGAPITRQEWSRGTPAPNRDSGAGTQERGTLGPCTRLAGTARAVARPAQPELGWGNC